MGHVETKTLRVEGMHCSGCANTLGTVLSRLEGVIRAEADVDRGEVEVRFDSHRVTEHQLADGIRQAGYEPA